MQQEFSKFLGQFVKIYAGLSRWFISVLKTCGFTYHTRIKTRTKVLTDGSYTPALKSPKKTN